MVSEQTESQILQVVQVRRIVPPQLQCPLPTIRRIILILILLIVIVILIPILHGTAGPINPYPPRKIRLEAQVKYAAALSPTVLSRVSAVYGPRSTVYGLIQPNRGLRSASPSELVSLGDLGSLVVRRERGQRKRRRVHHERLIRDRQLRQKGRCDRCGSSARGARLAIPATCPQQWSALFDMAREAEVTRLLMSRFVSPLEHLGPYLGLLGPFPPLISLGLTVPQCFLQRANLLP